jgi:hypothetical protein
MNVARRLDRLGRQLGCRLHGELLHCAACEPDEPPPPDLFAAMEALVDRIVDRAGVEELRRRVLPVPRPLPQAPCPRCRGRRECARCQIDYAKAMLRACRLTAAEEADMGAVLALARRLDAQRASEGRWS